MRKAKQRLDLLMVERGLAPTRAKAQGLIMAGEVLVNGKLVDKPGTKLLVDVSIVVKEQPLYVSRGGEKLAAALADFKINVKGRIAADVGASTGGFTDCLLQNGVAKVYAIDVGYGQLAHKLRINERVIVMERTNARYLEKLDEPVNLVVVDASFISLQLLLPAIQKWLLPEADIIALIKPQFEAGKHEVGKGGVVRDGDVHARVIQAVADFASSLALHVVGLTMSPIKGAKEGNTEFLIWFQHGIATRPLLNLEAAIEAVVATD
jgi:23S rRNA (cytidine1920-2'-O)/16S rRNA (cytidine1409-2'-O)-methyltransferase